MPPEPPARLVGLENLDKASALEAIRSLVKRLVLRSRMQAPPVNPARLAILQHVVRIEIVDMKPTGMLLPLPDGAFVIRLNRRDRLERQNFTCCHELAHTFFSHSAVSPAPMTDLQTGQYDQHQLEEYLCDRAAAELLMPDPWFEDSMEHAGLSIESIARLARTFGVSREVAAIRAAHSARWRVCLIKWKFMARPESVAKLRVDWAAVPDGNRLYVPRGKPISEDSPIFATCVTGRPTSGYYPLELGNLKGEFFIESIRLYQDSVLTLVHLNRLPVQSPPLALRYQNHGSQGFTYG